MASYAITSIGVDRPGIVAAVTKVLLDLGCNLEDTAMSILRGQFAMVMVVAAPEPSTAADLERAIVEGTAGFDLVTAVREVHEAGHVDAAEDGAVWTVVVYGPDHPGIVHVVASTLAAQGVNITDVTTRVSGADSALYSMVMEVVLPAGVGADDVRTALESVAEREGLTVRLNAADADLF